MFNLNAPIRYYWHSSLDPVRMENLLKEQYPNDYSTRARLKQETAREARKALEDAGLEPSKKFYHDEGDDAEAKVDAAAYSELQRQALKDADIDYPIWNREGMSF